MLGADPASPHGAVPSATGREAGYQSLCPHAVAATVLAAGAGISALFTPSAAAAATDVSRSGPLCYRGLSFRESDSTRRRWLKALATFSLCTISAEFQHRSIPLHVLSNVEILERALAKARANNPHWKPLIPDRPEDLIQMGHENMVLFNRGFAQAFWGTTSYTVVPAGNGGGWGQDRDTP